MQDQINNNKKSEYPLRPYYIPNFEEDEAAYCQQSRICILFAKALPNYIEEMYSTFADVASWIDALEVQA